MKLLSPLGVLIASCALAVAGLLALSKAEGLTILAAATLYGTGKAYLWPTMLGIVAERFPKGGALSLNATSAVGMMSVGVMGTVFLGLIQDRAVETRLHAVFFSRDLAIRGMAPSTPAPIRLAGNVATFLFEPTK